MRSRSSVDRNRPTSESVLFLQGVFNRVRSDRLVLFSSFKLIYCIPTSSALAKRSWICVWTQPLPCFPIWDMDSEKGFFRMIRWANFLDVRRSPMGSDLCLFRRPYWSSAAPTTARNSRLPRSNMDLALKPLIPQSLPVAAQTWRADLKAGCFWSKSPSVPSETCGQTDPWDPLCLVYLNLSSPC